jgi:hypothetical protein
MGLTMTIIIMAQTFMGISGGVVMGMGIIITADSIMILAIGGSRAEALEVDFMGEADFTEGVDLVTAAAVAATEGAVAATEGAAAAMADNSQTTEIL